MKQKRFDVTEIILITAIILVAVFTIAFALIHINKEGMSDKYDESTANRGNSGEMQSEYVFDYSEITGSYMDEYSQRAGMTVELNSDMKSVAIVVRWSGSATEYGEWTMDAVMGQDGKLMYDNCARNDISSTADGSEIEDTIYTGGKGYFELLADGRLNWAGASEGNCTNCIFVKTE